MLSLIRDVRGFTVTASVYQDGDGSIIVIYRNNRSWEPVDRISGATPELILRRLAELDGTD